MTPSDNLSVNDHTRGKRDLQGVALLLLIATGFFYPMLFGGQVIFYRDYNLITFPLRYFLGQTFQQGAIPYWIPHAHGGMPFMATFHPGVFYPPSVFLFLEDTTYALNLFYVFHFAVLGVFAFLLARDWKISFASALCCGITAMLSGFIIAATLVSNFFISAVWLPMVFWMFHRYWTRGSMGYFAGFVLAILIQTLAACPEINIMTMLLLYVHSLVFLSRKPGWRGIARLTVAMGLAVVLALGLSALQLVPTAKMVKHTFRNGGLTFKQHSGWSMAPEKLLTFLISPDYQNYFETSLVSARSAGQDKQASEISGDSGTAETSTDHTGPSSATEERSETQKRSGLLHTYYMGITGIFFVFMGFWFRREKEVAFWLGILGVGIFFALGKYNPVYQYVYSIVPFLNMFRYPEKYIYVGTFAVIFLTGFGLDSLIRGTRNRSINIFSVITILIVMFGIIGWVVLGKKIANPEYSLGLLFAFGLSYIIYYFGKIGERTFVVIVILVILLDLSIKDTRLLPLIDRKYYEEKPLLMDIVGGSFGKYRIYSGKIEKTPQPFRYADGPTPLAQIIGSKEQLMPYMGMIHSVEHVNGYVGLALALENQFLWLQVYTHSPPERRKRILKRSNVKYWIDRDTPLGYVNGYPVILPNRVKVFEDALPRAFLVPGMRPPDDKTHTLNVYYDESFDPLKEVLLGESVDFQKSDHFEGKVEDVSYRPNGVTVRTRQEGNGFLVLMDSYFPGWTVKVDGKEQRILQANHFYRAVQLDSGAHTLEFEFVPEGFKTGLMISGISLILLIAGALLWGRFGNKPKLDEKIPDAPL